MKKLLALILCTIMLFPVCALGEDTNIAFDASITAGLDWTSTQIMQSSESRATFTVAIITDLFFKVTDVANDIDLGSASYVCKSETVIGIYFHGLNDVDYLITYVPITGNADYTIFPKTNNAAVEAALDSVSDYYYKNDLEMLLKVLQSLQENL